MKLMKNQCFCVSPGPKGGFHFGIPGSTCYDSRVKLLMAWPWKMMKMLLGGLQNGLAWKQIEVGGFVAQVLSRTRRIIFNNLLSAIFMEGAPKVKEDINKI